MNKTVQLVFVVCAFSSCINSFGQSNVLPVKELRDGALTENTYLDFKLIGVSTNINYGNANNSLKDHKRSIIGLLVGASFQAGVAPKISLVPELYFVMKGGKLNFNNPLSNNEMTIRFYAMELPILARFHFKTFYLNTGPSIAYNMKGTRKMNNISSDVSFVNSTDSFRRFDFGIQTGGGYTFLMGQKRVALDLRYCYGVTNISYDKEMYNRNIILSVQFSKPWKKKLFGKK